MSRKYVIINADEVDSVDFSKVDETSADTVRFSTDGSQTFVKYEGDHTILSQTVNTNTPTPRYLQS